jgi:hypothetical protein
MLKKILAALAVSSLVCAEASAQEAGFPASQNNQPAPVSPSGIVTVRKHSSVNFVTVQPTDSTTAKVGDDIPLQLAVPVIADGVTLLPAGTIVHGKVLKVKKAGPCRNGEVKWKLDKIPFPDGTTAKVIPYPRNPSVWSDPDLGPGIVLAPIIFTFWGLHLAFRSIAWPFAHLAGEKDFSILEPCAGPVGHEYHFPANTPVILMFPADHRVRH